MDKIKEDVFWNEYKPQINHIERARVDKSVADEDICSYSGCLYETYGEDIDYINSLVKEGKVKHIWTVLDCEGELVISSGKWHVNRMGYIVTEKPWSEDMIEVDED